MSQLKGILYYVQARAHLVTEFEGCLFGKLAMEVGISYSAFFLNIICKCNLKMMQLDYMFSNCRLLLKRWKCTFTKYISDSHRAHKYLFNQFISNSVENGHRETQRFANQNRAIVMKQLSNATSWIVISKLWFYPLPAIKQLWEDHINSLTTLSLFVRQTCVLPSPTCFEQLRTQALKSDHCI